MAADDAANAPDASPTDLLRVRLHRRDHRPVQGLRDQQQLLRHPRPSDRDHVGARSRRRGVDAAAAVPLQRGVGGARRHAAHRWAGERSTGSSRCRTSGPRSTAPAPRTRARSAAWSRSSPTTPCAPKPPTPGMPEANTTLRFMSGVPMPPAVIEKCVERFGIRPFDAGYGTTEGSLWSWLPPGMENKPNAAGVVNDEYWDIRIFDDDDNEVPVETPGEIVGRPRKPNVVFDGYWGRPEATVEMFRNLWMHSGDIGRLDADRFLYFMDRKADYMRRRGENVSTLRDRRGVHPPPRGRRRGGVRGAEPGHRGRHHGRGRDRRRARRSPRKSCTAGRSTRSRTSHCRATSRSATSCRAAT